MKISEKQIYKLFHIVYASTLTSNTIGGTTQKDRREIVEDIIEQQSKQVIDTRDFELMKLADTD